mmetsp:Transcript_14075/g.26049  ORF Transcript_14075/g.26049 Transcript_14075/m.26049 type:complete len:340 (-) Transcript_14075:133-1152(-)
MQTFCDSLIGAVWHKNDAERSLSQETLVRKVREGDREWVEEVGKSVYGGEDYVPRVFDAWIKDDHFWALVDAEDENKVFAIVNVEIVPGKEDTATFGGLRVHPDHRGKGMGTKVVLGAAKQEIGVNNFIYTTFSPNKPSERLALKAGFKLVYNVPYMAQNTAGGTEPDSSHYSTISTESVAEWADRLEEACDETVTSTELREISPAEAVEKLRPLNSSRPHDLIYHHWDFIPLNEECVSKELRTERVFEGLGAISFGGSGHRGGARAMYTIHANSGDDQAVIKHAIHCARLGAEAGAQKVLLFLARPEGAVTWPEELFGGDRRMIILAASREELGVDRD